MYYVSLKQFEGPLDLLLHLIRKAKIPIEDIFVSQITEQYIAYMEQLKEVDLDRASEFIETAALLLDRTCDLSDVLVFAGAAFGGELLLLLVKRVFAKSNDKEDGGTYDG